MERRYKKYFAVMVLCFLVGGFSVIMYAMQAYSVLMGLDTYGSFREFREHLSNESLGNRNQNDFINGSARNRFAPPNPERFFISPASLMLLFVGLISILSGISIFNLIREREVKITKDSLTSILLSPEERSVIEEIKKANGELTQSQIVIKTGLSKVKIHRVISRLESKGIVKKYQYGLTNKIILEKDTL